MSAKEIHALVQRSLDAYRMFEEATQPFVREWVELAVKKQHLTPEEAGRDFHLDDLTTDDTGLIFESEDWEETWQYGGYEKHYGRSITIPFDFFDNPQPYRDAAEKELQDRIAFKNRFEARDKQQRVKDLERQLAKARKEL